MHCSGENPTIAIEVSKAGDRAVITVMDNGCGMSAEGMKQLFKPFYTTKAHGTGLGLVIVKKMLTKMNGTIDIASWHNVGAVVEISMPEGTNEGQ